jgi:BirA family biotin operon repressor/biotin-[acetyl-CoA-carboxylase] ligase
MIIGRKIIRLGITSSTNDVAKRFAEAGEPEGLVVIAEHQTQGRGRRGRGWVSQPGKSVMLSALVRPGWPDTDAPWLGVLGGVACAEAVKACGLRNVMIKWPNDVLVGERKIGGVLVEPRLSDGRVEFAILGVGINVLQREADWPEDLKNRVTSFAAQGSDASVAEAADMLIRKLDESYGAVRSAGPAALLVAWTNESRSSNLPVLD